MPETIPLSACRGCLDDFYNQPGNTFAEGGCWNRQDATMVKVRMIPIDMRPPYDKLPIETHPSCYRRQRFVPQPVEIKRRSR